MEEKVFYQEGNVLVTNSRLVIGSRTFAMRNLASVEMGIIEKKPSLLMGFALMIGIGLLLFGSWSAKGFGVLCLALCFLYIRSLKSTFTVRIDSNAGTIDGLGSYNRGYIEEIVEAINVAIMANH